MKNIQRLLLIFIAAMGSLVLNQNCSQMALEKYVAPSIYEAPLLGLKSSVCGDVRGMAPQSSKFIFVLDMSASNLGKWYKKTVGSLTYSYFDKSLGTDANGARFAAVEYFLDHCGSSAGSQFAVIGFSSSAGVISAVNGVNSWSCDQVQFSNSQNVKANLASLKSVQDADKLWYYKWVEKDDNGNLINMYLREQKPASVLMDQTNYTSALTCAQNLVINDLQNGQSQTNAYHIFFVSDGAPKDSSSDSAGCNATGMTEAQSEQCHLDRSSQSITFMRAASLSKGRDLKLHGIFYEKDSSQPVPNTLNAITQEGGVTEVLRLGDFSLAQDSLCKLVVTESHLEYRPEDYSAVVLTNLRKGGKIFADSDMDGVTDEEESQLGWNPQNSRSQVSGVLDGICKRLGGTTACQAKRQQITCNENKVNHAGLTDCDWRMLGLDLRADADLTSWGIDSDHDGMIDFVEIIKGTNPGLADMSGDPDGDGTDTRKEIINGRDPFIPDSYLPEFQLNNLSSVFDSRADNECPYGRWNLDLSRIQVSRTFEYVASEPTFTIMNHLPDEQMVMLIYRKVPTNSSQPEIEYYGKFVGVSYLKAKKTETVKASVSQVGPTDFVLMGAVKP